MNDFNNEKLQLEDSNFSQETYYSDDSIYMYVSEAGKYPILSVEEEKKSLELITKYRQCIKKHNLSYKSLSILLNKVPEFINEDITLDEYNIKYYLMELNTKVSSLSPKVKNRLINALKILIIYENNYNKIFNHNLRLVIHIANKYSNNKRIFLDLIQAGNIGLMRAINKFDQSYNTKFSTYAVYWIERFIKEELNNSINLIKIPRKVIAEEMLYKEVLEDLEKLSIPPTIDNIYDRYLYKIAKKNHPQGTEEEIAACIAELSKKITQEKMSSIERNINLSSIISLEQKIKSCDDNVELQEIISDENSLFQTENTILKKDEELSNYTLIKNAMQKNDHKSKCARKKMIICLLYGLNITKYLTKEEIEEVLSENISISKEEFIEKYIKQTQEPLSKATIKDLFNISNERVRQIEFKELRLLKEEIINLQNKENKQEEVQYGYYRKY